MAAPAPRPARPEPPRPPVQLVTRKLPHVVALFWALKITAVTLGETSGDLFGITLHLGYLRTAVVFFAFFAVVVTLQVRARRFQPVLYWAVILGTSMVGTEISDFIDRGPGSGSAQNGLGYGWGSIILTLMLLGVFVVWWRTGQTYDVENVASRKGEILYWTAILLSNTLGTASGDWLAHGTGLGFRDAFGVIAAAMIVILILHYLTSINGILLFWLAFILTRPLGAAGGDSLIKPVPEGGLGWGTLGGSVALLVLLVGLVAYQTWHVARQPLEPLPAPVNRRTGAHQHPNGALVPAIRPPAAVTWNAVAGSVAQTPEALT